MIARDAPGMADIDSKFLIIFKKKFLIIIKVVLFGECADEISLVATHGFIRKRALYSIDGFPWMRDLDKRMELFSVEIQALNIKIYVMDKYIKH